VPRFFWDEAQKFFVLIGVIFQERLGRSVWLEDIANILGKQISIKNVIPALQGLSTPWSSTSIFNKSLTEDERFVLGYYMVIKWKQESNDTQWTKKIITELIQTSVGGGSQLITFELQI
jgi:hypothetical protein